MGSDPEVAADLPAVPPSSTVFDDILRYFEVFQNIGILRYSRYFAVFRGISRYFAVFCGISRYFAVFRGISRYFVVFSGIQRYSAVFVKNRVFSVCRPTRGILGILSIE